MRIRLSWSTIFSAALLLLSLKMLNAEEKAHIRIPHVTHAPRMEQFINGEKREAELEITDFRQRTPLDGAKVTQPTTAYLSYDDRNLYVAFVCTADPRTLRAHMSKRENIADDDVVSVALDTYHDRQRAYEFFSNPLGVQEDAITAEGMDNDDFSFDTTWRSEGKITRDGYIVFFSIPFKSLRFHSRIDGTWGIALSRSIPGNGELSTWPLLTQKVEAYVPQFATTDSPQNVKSSHNMEFVPYFFASKEKFLDTTPVPATNVDQMTYRGGVDAKVVIHDAITVDATANPDFSQIESDEPQVTTNQRYEVFFPEKRPFFLENSDFFQTPQNLLFTRRIVDPQFGLRVTGKIGGWKVGFLGVDDRAPGKTLPVTDPFFGDRARIFAGRLQRTFYGSSNIGAMFTRRQFGGGSTSVWSVDSRVKLGANWVFTGQFMQSLVQSLGAANSFGMAGFGELRHVGRKFNSITTYIDRTNNFAGDELGFFQRTNIRQAQENISYHWRPETGVLQSAGPEFLFTGTVDQKGQVQDWSADLPFVFNFKGPVSFSVGRTESAERYLGPEFRKNSSYASFSSNKWSILGFNAFYAQGTEINFFPAQGVQPSLGNQTDASAGVTFKPIKRLQIEEKYILSRLTNPSGKGVLFENHIARMKVNLQFTRPLSFRVIADYNSLQGDPLQVDLSKTKRLNYDALVTYYVHPGTALYLGYSDRYENLLLDPLDALGFRRTPDPFHRTSRQFFVKLSYALHL